MTQNYGITNINYLKPIKAEEPVILVDVSTLEPTATELVSFIVDFEFGETVFGFISNDIVVTNGTKSNFVGSGKDYSIEITPTAFGIVTVDIPLGSAHNRVGYKNSDGSLSKLFTEV